MANSQKWARIQGILVIAKIVISLHVKHTHMPTNKKFQTVWNNLRHLKKTGNKMFSTPTHCLFMNRRCSSLCLPSSLLGGLPASLTVSKRTCRPCAQGPPEPPCPPPKAAPEASALFGPSPFSPSSVTPAGPG